MLKRRPYQFSLKRVLIMTAAMAAALAAARAVNVPILEQTFLGIYAMLLLFWAFLRWPVVHADLRRIRQRRLSILKGRQDFLERWRENWPAADSSSQSDRVQPQSGDSQ
jgi:hypothetical protein